LLLHLDAMKTRAKSLLAVRPLACSATLFIVTMGAFGPIAQADEVDACFNAAEQAQALHRQSKLRQARQQLEVCTRSLCPRALRGDCRAWTTEVEAELAWLSLRVLDPKDRELGDARVELDGQPVLADGIAVEIDPGDHAVHVERPGSAPEDRHISLRAGEHSQVSITLLPSKANEPATQGSLKLDAGASTPYRREEPSRTIPLSGWVFGGVALASLGATAALWVVGMNERSDLVAGCGVTHSCSPSDVDASHEKLLIGDATLGAGLLALGAATWLTLSSWSKKPVAQVRVGRVPGGAMGVLEAHF
jgi:hypothetical protein